MLGCSRRKAVYNPKTFFLHAASLGQGFPHCPIFSTAASRRSRVRVAVPLLADKLSLRRPVIALVGHYPTNKLISRRPFPNRIASLPFGLRLRDYRELSNLSISYARVWGKYLRVTNPFAGDTSTSLALSISIPMTCMPYPRR